MKKIFGVGTIAKKQLVGNVVRSVTPALFSILFFGASASFVFASGLAPASAPCNNSSTAAPFLTLTQRITNDPDSGNLSNWATDAFDENVSVWLGTDGTTYCANANTTDGTFVTTGPLSPEKGNPLSAGITGTFTGGENYVFPPGTILNTIYSTTSPQTVSLPASSIAGFSWWVNQVFPLIATSSGSSNVQTYSLTYITPGNGTWTDADPISGGDTGDITSGPVIDTTTDVGYATIQAALSAASAGDTITVASGTYTGDLIIPVNNLTLVGSNAVLNLGSVYGINLDNGPAITGFTLKGFTVNSTSGTTYALKAYKANGLTLTNDTFNGNGFGGGVDINTTSNVTFNNVTANGFHKNGFADTAAYTTADAATPGSGITFNGITASNNGWTGISFYTVGNDKSTVATSSIGGSASITGVTFTGSNTISGNGGGASNGTGLLIEGDSDANVGAHNTPANTVTSDGHTLDLTGVAFSGNSHDDIVNYQTAPINAIGATFSGVMGNNMTASQQTTENGLIIDSNDIASLGTVTYFNPPLTSTQVALTSSTPLSTTTPQVVVTSSDTTPATITVPADVTAPTLDASTLLSGFSLTLPSSVTVDETTSGGATVDLSIPSGTTVTASGSWSGVINLPQVITPAINPPAATNSTVSVTNAIEIGAGNTPLTLSSPVSIFIAGAGNQLAGWEQNGTFSQISNKCDTNASNTTINGGSVFPTGGDCSITVGSDLVIWTEHFTTFLTYTQTSAAVSSGGGGGGGGIVGSGPLSVGYVNTTATTQTNPPPTTTSSQQGQVLGAAAYNFTQALSIGSSGEDVTQLQQLLTQEGFYSGPVTGYFGSLTQAGVIAFQKGNGLPQVGVVGPKTRAILNEGAIPGSTTPQEGQVKGASAYNFTTSLAINSQGPAVTALQQQLTQEGYYNGPVTGHFGPVTQAAVMKFQAHNSLPQVGIVGPKTRAILNLGVTTTQ